MVESRVGVQSINYITATPNPPFTYAKQSTHRFLVMLTDTSTRSRMIWSTSRPWKPTSVNLVASTLMKGASDSLAMRRAISVCCVLWVGE